MSSALFVKYTLGYDGDAFYNVKQNVLDALEMLRLFNACVHELPRRQMTQFVMMLTPKDSHPLAEIASSA